MVLLTQDSRYKLNKFQQEDYGKALEDLADIAFKYYSEQCVDSEHTEIIKAQGAAQFARWLKKLPKALRDGPERSEL